MIYTSKLPANTLVLNINAPIGFRRACHYMNEAQVRNNDLDGWDFRCAIYEDLGDILEVEKDPETQKYVMGFLFITYYEKEYLGHA